MLVANQRSEKGLGSQPPKRNATTSLAMATISNKTIVDIVCRFQQQRQILMDRAPDNPQVHAKRLLNQDISKILDFAPWNIRKLRFQIFGQLANRFTNNLELTNHGGVAHSAVAKLLEFEAYDVQQNSLPRVLNVCQIELEIAIRRRSYLFVRLC